MSSLDIFKGRRIAIIVGINKYDDPAIPQLSGAENDAQELFNILTSEKGGFENNRENLIMGEQATQRNIVKRVCDIFRNDEKFDIAMFYFSGHGFLDKRDELYLSTYDVDRKDPYIGGIRINDLKREIYTSTNKQSALLILDCCYSGTATKDTTNADNEIKNVVPILEKNFENIEGKENYGEGKFTIASSATNKVSWEEKDCMHLMNNQPHVHGAFTYNLIKGIEGAAANQTNGIITLGSLQQYIDTKMLENKKQKSYYNDSEARNINNILIALSIEQYIKNVKNLEVAFMEDLEIPDSSFPSIRYVIEGTRKMKELERLNPTNPSIKTMNERIASQLAMFKNGVIEWCFNLSDPIKIKIERNTERDFIEYFTNEVGIIDIEKLVDIDDKLKEFLSSFGNEVKNKTKFLSVDDPKFSSFLIKLSVIYKRNKTSEQVVS
jgi:hypothetical protein